MTHEEYIAKTRARIGAIAKAMIDEKLDYLEGCIELAKLQYQAELADDEDMSIFSKIDAEMYHLPIGSARQYWSNAGLERHQKEIEETTEWTKEISLENCHLLIKRFSV